MKRIKGFILDSRKPIAVTVFLIIYFFREIYDVGISTHDSLAGIVDARAGTFSLEFSPGRLSLPFGYFTTVIQSSCSSMLGYKLFTLLGLLISCFTFFWFIYKLTESYDTSWSILILLFLFAQITPDHNGFFSFSFSYQFFIAFIYASLALYIDYLNTRDKKFLISSAVLYFIGSLSYECIVLYGILFFIVDCYYLILKKQLCIMALFKDLISHFVFALFYVSLYFGSRMIFREDGGTDAAIGGMFGIIDRIRTVIVLSSGLAPLSYFKLTGVPRSELIIQSFEPTLINIARMGIIVVILTVVYNLIVEIPGISIGSYLFLTVVCLFGTVLPSVPLAMTDKFVAWVLGGTRSFGTSYYSYFFIIAWIIFSVVFIYQRVGFKSVYIVTILILAGIIAEITLKCNDHFIESFSKRQEKYDLFDGLVRSEYFGKIDDNAIIIFPEYSGVHFDINSLAVYSNAITGKNLKTYNEMSRVTGDVRTYLADLDLDKDSIYLSEIGQDGLTDEIFVYSMKSLQRYGIICDRESGKDAKLYINGEPHNIYKNEIVSEDLGIKENYAVFSCEKMKAGTFELFTPGNSFDNGAISLVTDGIYNQESWGRWARKESHVYVNNNSDISAVDLHMDVVTSGKEKSKISVSCGDYTEDFNTDGLTKIHCTIPVIYGTNDIVIKTSSPDIETQDVRQLNLSIYDMYVEFDDMVFLVNNPEIRESRVKSFVSRLLSMF